MGRSPDFLIIGAYKCGTTSLLEYLGQHPQIFLPWLQEPNHFVYPADARSDSLVPEVDWQNVYRRHRAKTPTQYDALFSAAAPGDVVGECSPEYMRSEHAWQRIHEELPDVRLVALLRSPVDRAYSEYQAFVRDGVERDSFEVAVRRPQNDEPGHQYVSSGFYGAQLRPYLERFPRERVKVLLTEELRVAGVPVLRDLGAWLGVDTADWTPDLSSRRNVSGRPVNAAVSAAYRVRRRWRPWLKPVVPGWLQTRADDLLATGLRREAMSPALRAELIDVYRDDIRLLEELTERDLSAWLT